jgi:adenylylsulfate reductase subunit B
LKAPSSPYDGKPEAGDLENELLFTESALKAPKEALGKKIEVGEADLKVTFKSAVA